MSIIWMSLATVHFQSYNSFWKVHNLQCIFDEKIEIFQFKQKQDNCMIPSRICTNYSCCKQLTTFEVIFSVFIKDEYDLEE